MESIRLVAALWIGLALIASLIDREDKIARVIPVFDEMVAGGLIALSEGGKMFENILVAIDASAKAQQALEFAVELARRHSVQVRVIIVVPLPEYGDTLSIKQLY